MPSIRRRVALLLEHRTSYDRRVVRGLAAYARENSWELLSEAYGDVGASALRNNFFGAIAAVTDRRQWRRLRTWRLPVVNVSGAVGIHDLPTVCSDNAAIGRMAAEHFLERGFRSFAFAGPPGVLGSHERLQGFSERLAQVGFTVESLDCDIEWSRRWQRERLRLERWLSHLTRPFALFVVNDILARRVLQACERQKIQVPDQCAVLGVGDYALLNELAPIPISSVVQDAEQIGRQAAELLTSLAEGRATSSARILIPPLGVVARLSSDTNAVDHPQLASALDYIRQNLSCGLKVSDLADHLSVSRRWLEMQFQQHLGCSPRGMIRTQQIVLAKRLLVETDWPLAVIARRCGLASPERLSTMFRGLEGMPPSTYRTRMRAYSNDL